MRNLAIIPARGGSKRIPRKNIRDFLGKPIIAYSINAALQSGSFDEVMVSTDDEEIAEVARKHGARVPFMRSPQTANDHATMVEVIDEVKDRYLEMGTRFTGICCLLATAPLVTVANLVKGRLMLEGPGVDSVRPLVRFGYPIQRALRLTGDRVEYFHPEHASTRSQDLEPAYHDAAQFYWMKYETGLRSAHRYGFVISELDAQDIDNEEDWRLAEIKYRFRQEAAA